MTILQRAIQLPAIFLLLVPALPSPAADKTLAVSPPTDKRTELSREYRNLTLAFEPNVGQTDARVRFLARGGGMTAFFTDTETVMVLRHGEAEQAVVSMKLEKSLHGRPMTGLEKQPGISNYYIGNDPKKWHTDVPHYSRVQREGVYAGIDMVWYGNQRQLEYDFVVKAGADPKQIQVAYEGAQSLKVVESNGDLVLRTSVGDMRQLKPRVYQEVAGRQVEVAAQYSISTRNRVTFALADYDRERELRIDPIVLMSSTYLGGSGQDWGYGIATDPYGYAYSTGFTTSVKFPAFSSMYQKTNAGGRDIFITEVGRYNLVYSTYLGGSGDDTGLAIAVDQHGAAFITGFTDSKDFPTLSPYQGTFGGNYDVFATKLNALGYLAFSTYAGGSGAEYGQGIAVDAAGSAYVTGMTNSISFPTKSPFQSSTQGGNTDGFVMKLTPAGSDLAYSTYLGGNANDSGNGIAVDSAGSAYVTGMTNSTNFPTISAYQTSYQGGTTDAFIAKLTPAGNALVYSTYLGGGDEDVGYGVAVDPSGSAFVTGYTNSANFPVQSGYQTTFQGSGDAFVTKVAPRGIALVYSTYLGGNGRDSAQGIALDPAGSAYVAGSTTSVNFPTLLAVQAVSGGGVDVFVSKLTAAGDQLSYSTYLGGSGSDYGQSVALSYSDSAKVTGYTDSSNFPTLTGLQSTYQGAGDAFVAMIPGMGIESSVTLSMASGSQVPGQPIELPIQLAANTMAMPTAFQTDLSFDHSKLAFVSARAGEQLIAVNRDLGFHLQPSGDERVLGYGFNNNTIANGVVAYATFTLNPLFTTGNTVVTLKNCSAVDAKAKDLPAVCNSATVTAFTCDLNSDGSVNVSDLQIVINEAMGRTPPVHDLNHDGVVDVADVQKIVNVLMGNACSA